MQTRRPTGWLCALALAAAPTSVQAAPPAHGLPGVDPDLLTVPKGALARLTTALARFDQPVVVTHYGDSHSQSGYLAKVLRQALAGGRPTSPGYLQPKHPLNWDGHVTTVGRWREESWLSPKHQGPFGPMGIAYVTDEPGARLKLRVDVSWARSGSWRLHVLFENRRPHMPLRVLVGNAVVQPQVAAEVPMARWELPMPAGTHEVELAADPGEGELRVYGVLAIAEAPTVQWDTLAVMGTTVAHPLQRSDEALDAYLHWRRPDLLVWWYGTNSAVEPKFSRQSYRQAFDAMLTRAQTAAPQAACLVVAAPDLARRPEACFAGMGQPPKGAPASVAEAAWHTRHCTPELLERSQQRQRRKKTKRVRPEVAWQDYVQQCSYRTPEQLAVVNEVQREVALARGCAFFDTFALMGGAGSMHQWVCETPRKAMYDHVHLNREGYTAVGEALAQSLRAALAASKTTPR